MKQTFEFYYKEITDREHYTFARTVREYGVLVYLHTPQAMSTYYRYFGRFNRRPSLRYLRDHNIKLKRITKQ